MGVTQFSRNHSILFNLKRKSSFNIADRQLVACNFVFGQSCKFNDPIEISDVLKAL